MKNEKQKRLKSYNEHIEIVNKNIAINEKFREISIITFCTIGFVVSIEVQQEYSLFLFLASIILNFLSFYFGDLSCLKGKEFAFQYYIEQKEEYFDKKCIYNKVCYYLNIISPFCCILGLISLI